MASEPADGAEPVLEDEDVPEDEPEIAPELLCWLGLVLLLSPWTFGWVLLLSPWTFGWVLAPESPFTSTWNVLVSKPLTSV
jgi:hypothetical protein